MGGLLEIMSTWSGPGQGLFLMTCLFAGVVTFQFLVFHLVVLVRGWPPVEEQADDESDGPRFA